MGPTVNEKDALEYKNLTQLPAPSQRNRVWELVKPQSLGPEPRKYHLLSPQALGLPSHLVIQRVGVPWTTLSTKLFFLFSVPGLHLPFPFHPPHRMLWWSRAVGLWLLNNSCSSRSWYTCGSPR